MIRSRFVRSATLVFAAFATLSCADSPTGLSAPKNANDALLSGLLGGLIQTVTQVVGFVGDATGLTIHPVKWADSRAKVSYSVSGTISPWGGTLTIPQADFSITFPMGAVSQPTNITITSDPSYVAYQMEPHGILFAKPVTVIQRLRNTEVYGSALNTQLFGAYIIDDGLDLSTLLHALEIETSITIFGPPPTSKLPDTQIWIINHFSRYMLASG
ncbi:MAG: hypothetical protein ABR585_13470 [Gemmatimonadaceae bacterium]